MISGRSFTARARWPVWALAAFAALSLPRQASGAEAPVSQGTFGLGLNYPGLGARYFIADHYALEAKAQAAKDILVGGMRTYRYFDPRAGISPFVGLEADYVRFKGQYSKGSGVAGELLVGGEFFFARRLSAQADFGPAYIYLKDRATSLSVGGVEYVFNFGINFYFLGRRDR